MEPIISFSNNNTLIFNTEFISQHLNNMKSYQQTYNKVIDSTKVRIYTNQITQNIIFIFTPEHLTEYIWYMPEYKEIPQNFLIKDNTGFLDITRLNKKYSWIQNLFEQHAKKTLYCFVEDYGIVWKMDIPLFINSGLE